MKKSLIALALALNWICAFATSEIPTVAIPAAVPLTLSSSNQTEKSALIENIVELKAQNALLREYQQHLLSTVYWALGAIFTIAILLSGFSWYANFRIFDREKNELIDLVTKKVNFEAQNIRNDFLVEWQEQRVLSDNALNAKSEEIILKSKLALGELRTKLQTDMSDLKVTMLLCEAQIHDIEADKWEDKKVWINVIAAMARKIQLINQLGESGYMLLERPLERILNSLPYAPRPNAYHIKLLTEALESVSGPHQYSVAKIHAWIANN